jgi:flagellar biosynthesis protein FlhG
MTAVEDQAACLRQRTQGRVSMQNSIRATRCIAVASGKGGVGKTVVSIGVSMGLAAAGKKVLVLDADLGLANVDIQLGVEPRMTIQDVIQGGQSLADVVLPVRENLDLLASSSGAAEMADMGSARRGMFVDELLAFAAGYDYLIIDVAAGIDQSVTAFLQSTPEVIAVVANEPTSIMDVYSMIKTVTRSGNGPDIGIVVNMVRTLDEGERLYAKLSAIVYRFLGRRYPCLGVVPYDPVVGDAIRARKPVMEYAPATGPSICLKEIADGLIRSGRTGQLTQTDLSRFFAGFAGRLGGEGTGP